MEATNCTNDGTISSMERTCMECRWMCVYDVCECQVNVVHGRMGKKASGRFHVEVDEHALLEKRDLLLQGGDLRGS